MHWVVHASVFSDVNLHRLLKVLERAELPYTTVSINEAGQASPNPNPEGSVYVCGAQRAALLSQLRGWKPGSFLNENFSVDVWQQHIPKELLNDAAYIALMGSVTLEAPMFVRPLIDSKLFDGQLFTPNEFESCRNQNASFADVRVSVSPPKSILREYRLFVVAGLVVTGSLYRQGGEVALSGDVDPEVITYVERVIKQWSPAEAFVVDVALTDNGYKVIEFNNINSSGFYESDVARYVDAIERNFG